MDYRTDRDVIKSTHTIASVSTNNTKKYRCTTSNLNNPTVVGLID